MTDMRAKWLITKVEQFPPSYEGAPRSERIEAMAVSGTDPYGPEGESEDNTYARYTPQAGMWMMFNNPALLGQYKVGMKLYGDYTIAPE